MMAGKKLPEFEENAIKAAKTRVFLERTKPTSFNYQRLRLKAKCLPSSREEFEAFSEKYSYLRLKKAREIAGTIKSGGSMRNEFKEFRSDNISALAALDQGIRAYRSCNESGKKDLREIVVGTINRLIDRLHSEDVRMGKLPGNPLRAETRPFRQAVKLAKLLVDYGGNSDLKLYEVYTACLEFNSCLSQKLRLKMREFAIRIAPDRKEMKAQFGKFMGESPP